MATKKHTTVPLLLKQSISQKAEQLLQNKFKPELPLQAEVAQKHGYNYVTDLYTTWRGRYFYICAKYRDPRSNAPQEYFEVRTTRLEYIGGNAFSHAYMRHTGKWCEVYTGLSWQDCMETIEQEELFSPVL